MKPGEPDTKEEPSKVEGAVVQHRALLATAEVASAQGAQGLLSTTGPFAELQSADRRGILDAARRILIAKKGRGVVFEAKTVVAVQEASERYSLDLVARLSPSPTDPNADILVYFQGDELRLQLKAGGREYTRAAIRAKKDGTYLLVPGDTASEAWATGTQGEIDLDGIQVQSPTDRDLLEQTERCLDRMGRGAPVISSQDIAKRAMSDGLADGLVAVILDLSLQKLGNPQRAIDWNRAAKSFLRTSITSAMGSYVASANTVATVQVVKRGLDATQAFRAARVAASVAPFVLDTAIDVTKLCRGTLSTQGFLRNASGNAGASLAGYLAFPLIARLAVRCGPLGILVMVVGGAVVAKLGDKAGRGIFDALADLGPILADVALAMPMIESKVQTRVTSAVNNVKSKVQREAKRRSRLGVRRRCEEASCGRVHHARGMCSRHYQRWWRRQRRFPRRLYGA